MTSSMVAMGKTFFMGRAGDDIVIGSAGADLLRGDEGRDRLYAAHELTVEAALTQQDAAPSGLKGDFFDGGEDPLFPEKRSLKKPSGMLFTSATH